MNVIERAELLVLSYRYKDDEIWGWPGGTYRGWTTAFVRLTDTSGGQGLGEIGDGLNTPKLIPAIFDRAASQVEGLPVCPRTVVDALARSAPGWGEAGLFQSVIAGFELAVVDLLGTRAGVPAHALFGGAQREVMPAYASGGLSQSADAIHEEVLGYVARGFDAVKIRIGFGPSEDEDRVAAARSALGEERRLMVDLGASYLPSPPDYRDVVDLYERLHPYGIYWLEDPLPRRDVSGYVRLRDELPTRIAAGENERGEDLIRRWLDAGAIDILQTDALYVGGVLRQLELADLAAHWGVRLAPHTWCSGPGLMANLTAAAAAPNGVFVEVPQPPNLFREGTLREQLRFDGGGVVLPETPGLNVLLPESMEQMRFDESAGPVLFNAHKAVAR
jgi:L-alanine-DL-glutamate epimerase-like enolase superfamily enzyme